MVKVKYDSILGDLREAGKITEIEGMPISLDGKAKYLIDVNDAETGFEFSDEIEFGDCIFSAREEPETPDANEVVIYLTGSGISPDKVIEWKLKDESGNEVILYSMKI